MATLETTTNANGKRGADAGRRQVLAALRSMAKGDFSIRVSTDHLRGIDAELAEAFNDVVTQNAQLLAEVERVSSVVGREGRIAERADLYPKVGAWAAHVKSVNTLIDDLTHPIAETSRVLGSVARGDLSQQMVLDVEGRPLKGVPTRFADDQCDGRSAQFIRFRSYARRTRSRFRRETRRPSVGAWGRRHVERFDGLRQFDGRQSHVAGPQYGGSYDGRR